MNNKALNEKGIIAVKVAHVLSGKTEAEAMRSIAEKQHKKNIDSKQKRINKYIKKIEKKIIKATKKGEFFVTKYTPFLNDEYIEIIMKYFIDKGFRCVTNDYVDFDDWSRITVIWK